MARFTVAAVVAAAAAFLTCAGVGGSLINVGGKGRAWRPDVNYTDWASHTTVHVGDRIWFRYNRYLYDVLEVNQTSYERCISEGFLANITRGRGRDTFMVTQARPYYFICSKGSYCKHGMKLAINVTHAPAPASAPGSGPAAAPSPGSGPTPAPGSSPATAPSPAPGSGPTPAPGSGPATAPAPAPGSGPTPAPGSGPAPAPAPSAKSRGTSISQGVGTLMLGRVMLSFMMLIFVF